MGRREPSWDELRTFFEVCATAACRGGADARDHASRRSAGISTRSKTRSGLTLFTRSPRGLTATPAALALAPYGEAMAAAAAALAPFGHVGSRARSRRRPRDGERDRRLRGSARDLRRLSRPSIRASPSSLPSATATRTWRAAMPTSRCAWSVRRRAGWSRGASARRASASTRTATIAPASATPRSLADLPHHCVIGFDRDSRTFRSAGVFARALERDGLRLSLRQRRRAARGAARRRRHRRLSGGDRAPLEGPRPDPACRRSSSRSTSGSSCTVTSSRLRGCGSCSTGWPKVCRTMSRASGLPAETLISANSTPTATTPGTKTVCRSFHSTSIQKGNAVDKSVLGLLGGASALALVSGGGALAATAPAGEANDTAARAVLCGIAGSHSKRREHASGAAGKRKRTASAGAGRDHHSLLSSSPPPPPSLALASVSPPPSSPSPSPPPSPPPPPQRRNSCAYSAIGGRHGASRFAAAAHAPRRFCFCFSFAAPRMWR